MNSKICHDALVGIPEYFQKHQHLLLSIVELTIFYIAKVRFSRILSHPFQKSFLDRRKDEYETLSRYTCWQKHQHLLLSIVELTIFYIANVRFSRNLTIPFDTKVILLTREKMNSKICQDTLVGIPEYLQKHPHRLLSIVELPIFYIAKVRFSRILSHPFQKSFFDRRKDEFETLSRYTC